MGGEGQLEFKEMTHRERALSSHTAHWLWPQTVFLQRALKTQVKEVSVVGSQRKAAAKGRLVPGNRERAPASRVTSYGRRAKEGLFESQILCHSFKQPI